MRIGQIVFVNSQTFLDVQTGIIVRKEFEHALQEWWYEVLCNDGCNHVLPEQLLSLAKTTRPILDNNKAKNFAKKAAYFMQACTKNTRNQLNYIHNDKQIKNFSLGKMPHSQ